MNLFEAMLVGHLTGDYILQTRWMALNKEKKIGPLAVHSAVYSASVFLFAWPVQMMPVAAVLLVFVSHAILDRRAFVRWWMRHVSGIRENQPESPFVRTIIDQGFHIIVLALAAYAILFQIIR